MARSAALVVAAALVAGAAGSGGAPDAWGDSRRGSSPPRALAPARRTWASAGPGLVWTEFPARAGRVAIMVTVVEADPRHVRFALDANVAPNGRVSPWSLAAAPADAMLALNAGQFTDEGPWGWVVHRGREHRPPGTGPLSMALVVDGAGAVTLVPASDIDALRAGGRVTEAMQSYPALLTGEGELPEQLRRPGLGVDLDHRDTRLAVGVTADGNVLFALTRVHAPGILANAPLGPTLVEMAELMRSLGAVRAMMLDGGLSAQMLLRVGVSERRWEGMRKVPLGLVLLPRP